MRARGGGVLSASALVAVGTSLLLAALVGLGISELGTRDSGGAASGMRTEAASVVVPGGDAHERAATAHPRRHPHRPVTAAPVVAQPSASSGSTSGSHVSRTTASTRQHAQSQPAAKPSTTASSTPGNGKGKAKGAANGRTHHKPAKKH